MKKLQQKMQNQFLRPKKLISNPIFKLLVYANIFISLCASSQVLLTYVVFALPLNYNNYAYLAFVFLSTYLQYNMQRGYLINQNNLNSDRSLWLIKYKKPLFFGLAISLISLLFLCNNLSSLSIMIMVSAEVISTLYYLPPFNLRKHGYIKPFLISAIWVISCTVVPLIENKILSTHHSFFIFSQFLFIAVLCILFDLKDMATDLSQGVNTYANNFGAGKTKMICTILILISGYCFFAFAQNSVFIVAMIFILLTTLLTVLMSKKEKHPFYFYIWVDGLLLLEGIVFFLVSKIT